METRTYKYMTPRGGWGIEIFRNCNGFVFGNITQNGRHFTGWQTQGENILWDNIPTMEKIPVYVREINHIIWCAFTDRIQVDNIKLDGYIMYRVDRIKKDTPQPVPAPLVCFDSPETKVNKWLVEWRCGLATSFEQQCFDAMNAGQKASVVRQMYRGRQGWSDTPCDVRIDRFDRLVRERVLDILNNY